MYKVIKTFADLQDDGFRYNAGDDYPRKGLKVSSERLEELSTDKNKQHRPLIEKITEDTGETEEKSKPEITAEDTEEIEEKPKRRNRKKENDAGANS